MGVVFGVTSVAGPLAGGMITDSLGWRWLFFVAVPVGLVALFVITRFLDLPHEPRKAVIDSWGIVTMSLGVTATLLAVSWGGTSYPWGSPVMVGLFVAGAVLHAANDLMAELLVDLASDRRG